METTADITADIVVEIDVNSGDTTGTLLITLSTSAYIDNKVKKNLSARSTKKPDIFSFYSAPIR